MLSWRETHRKTKRRTTSKLDTNILNSSVAMNEENDTVKFASVIN